MGVSPIANVSASTNGFVDAAAMSAYTASKFAVRGLTCCAALDPGYLGIRVTSAFPTTPATSTPR